jgi:hypothetical protein
MSEVGTRSGLERCMHSIEISSSSLQKLLRFSGISQLSLARICCDPRSPLPQTPRLSSLMHVVLQVKCRQIMDSTEPRDRVGDTRALLMPRICRRLKAKPLVVFTSCSLVRPATSNRCQTTILYNHFSFSPFIILYIQFHFPLSTPLLSYGSCCKDAQRLPGTTTICITERDCRLVILARSPVSLNLDLFLKDDRTR